MGQSGLNTQVVYEGFRTRCPPPLPTLGVGGWLTATQHPLPPAPTSQGSFGRGPGKVPKHSSCFQRDQHLCTHPAQGDTALGARFWQQQGGDKETRARLSLSWPPGHIAKSSQEAVWESRSLDTDSPSFLHSSPFAFAPVFLAVHAVRMGECVEHTGSRGNHYKACLPMQDKQKNSIHRGWLSKACPFPITERGTRN